MEADAVDRLAKLISSLEHRDDLEELSATLRQAGVDPTAPRIAALLDLVERVRGLPRHLGQHTGGIVVAAGRLDEVVPIESSRRRWRTGASCSGTRTTARTSASSRSTSWASACWRRWRRRSSWCASTSERTSTSPTSPRTTRRPTP
jgi:hypothetical protein